MGPLVMGHCVMGHFVMGRFVMGRFACESLYSAMSIHEEKVTAAYRLF
jgi:hypothetical protein